MLRIERVAVRIASAAQRIGIERLGHDVVVRVAQRLQIGRVKAAVRCLRDRHHMIDMPRAATASRNRAVRIQPEMTAR